MAAGFGENFEKFTDSYKKNDHTTVGIMEEDCKGSQSAYIAFNRGIGMYETT